MYVKANIGRQVNFCAPSRTRWCFHVFRQIPPQEQSMDVANALAIYNWHCIKQRSILRICAQATMTLAPLSAANLVQTFVPSTFLAKTLGINLQIWSSEMWHGTICSRSSSPKRWAESCQSVPIWFTGEKAKMVCKDVRNTLVLPACSIDPSHGIMLHWSTCRHDSHFGQKFCGIKEWRIWRTTLLYAPLLSHFDLSFLHHFVLHIHWKMQTFLPQTASLRRASKIKVICWQKR